MEGLSYPLPVFIQLYTSGLGTDSLEDLGAPSVSFWKMAEIKSTDPCKQVAGWVGEAAGKGSWPSEV